MSHVSTQLYQSLMFKVYLCWSLRVASMTSKASWANCLASVVGLKIFRWLKEGVFGWTRTSLSRRISSKWMMSSIRLNAPLLSSSNWLVVMDRILISAWLAIDPVSEGKKSSGKNHFHIWPKFHTLHRGRIQQPTTDEFVGARIKIDLSAGALTWKSVDCLWK